MTKKLIAGMLLGSILGVFCIIGVSVRMPNEVSTTYLLAFWYNRIIIGFSIGLLPSLKSFKVSLLRGIIIGAFISFAFYSATEYLDFAGFMAGVLYGIIIEAVLYKLTLMKRI